MTGVGAEEKMLQSQICFGPNPSKRQKNSYTTFVMEEKNLPHPVFMRKKQILSERKSGDEDDLVDILTDHGISYG